MKRVAVVSLGPTAHDENFEYSFLGTPVAIEKRGTDGDIARAAQLIAEYDGKVDAIGLDSMNRAFFVAGRRYPIPEIDRLAALATRTPVVDGENLKSTFERWAVAWMKGQFPDVLKPSTHVFMPSGVERWHVAKVLSEYTEHLEFGDAMMHWGWPWTLKGLGTLEGYAEWFLHGFGPIGGVVDRPYKALYPTGKRQEEPSPRFEKAFRKADLIAGGLHYIRRYAPLDIRNKIVLTNSLGPEDLADLQRRGVRTVFTTTPEMNGRSYGLNVLEAVMVAVSGKKLRELKTEDWLRMITESRIEPRVVYPQGKPVDLAKFAFIIHPLCVDHIWKHPLLKYLRWLPERFVEWAVSKGPPIYLSHVTGARSATGKEVEGWLYALTATPKMLMRPETTRETYTKINQICQWAERTGAGIIGLGAFTSVVGDAGITIAKEADIAVTSGNSYTVASTMEAAKQVCRKMGHDPRDFSCMVIGATGSIGAVCSRLIAYVCKRVHLVAPRPEKLLELEHRIKTDCPDCHVTVSTNANDSIGDADLIITTTTSRGAKLFDFEKVKPGAVICDVARPLDIHEEDAAARPDVLVIESGELEVPGPVNFGTDIGLPPKTAYACLSETIILAMEGKYEDYSLGRNLEIDRVKEIYRLGKKHGFKLAHIRSFGRVLSDQEIGLIRERAEERRRAHGMKPLLTPDEQARALAEYVAAHEAKKKSASLPPLAPEAAGRAAVAPSAPPPPRDDSGS